MMRSDLFCGGSETEMCPLRRGELVHTIPEVIAVNKRKW